MENEMSDYLLPLKKLKIYPSLKDSVLRGVSCALFGVNEHKAYFLAELFRDTGKKFFIVVPDDRQARITKEILESEIGNVLLFPVKDYNFRTVEAVSRFDENRRLETLSRIRKGAFSAVVLPAEALCTLTVSPSEFRETVLIPGQEISFELLQKTLVDYGYAFYPEVEGPGQFSIRGGILDIFVPSEDSPFRIEFFGDEIDTVSRFDPSTQRRTEPADGVKITPAIEFSESYAQQLKEILQQHTANESAAKDLVLLESGILPQHDRYLPACYQNQGGILQYQTEDTRLVFFEHSDCLQSIEGYLRRLKEDIAGAAEDGLFFLDRPYALSREQILSDISAPLVLDTFPCSVSEFPPQVLLDVQMFATSVPALEPFSKEVRQYLDEGYDVTVLSLSKMHTEDLRAALGTGRKLHIEQAALLYGYLLPEIKTIVYSYRQKSMEDVRVRKAKFKRGEKVRSFSDISKGDYVVHENYGIGIYDGIHKVESLGVINDYIRIRFAGTDVLYIPCSQLDQISKYSVGGEETHVKLNKLGGTDWEKTKQKVKKSVKDLAKQLLALYGERLRVKGISYSPDTEWQRDFEASFPYEETDDQIKSINEIKKDMESPVPMDRLLCGDVGYGKTEVALRAVFKAVMDGKQVAILAPTTLLAFQHFNTMLERFSQFPVRVELLSRLRTPAQQKSILERLRNGTVDVLVGTHKILQQSVRFKDLGLIIIDEEQRFGVAHKEYLKETAKNADVLTLSATPIPRTLNMSMSGIRDISILNDPPQNRYPVTTYVAEYDLGLIVDAVKREVARGGQCFYLHNHIESIYKTAQMLYDRTGFRIQVAHGKMSQEDVAAVWEALVHREIDVLVCTTIIETGVDVPNCNTLIIEDADRLGLAQLHQIRGRVGRSDTRAFAYFLYRRGKTLSEDAHKRLMTIREYTEFGSGLKIAMRDLEIRGAGNVLGAEQSGHMLSVGYDMYMKLLSEAVQEEKGEKKAETGCTVDLRVSAYLPDSFIRDTETRIDIYKKIASIADDDSYSEVLDEIIDRFGDPPKCVMALLDIAKIKALAGRAGIRKLEEAPNGICLFLEKEPPMEQVADITAQYRRKLFYTPGQKPYYTLKTEKILPDLEHFLKAYQKCIDIFNV